jgi:hypothetical protein
MNWRRKLRRITGWAISGQMEAGLVVFGGEIRCAPRTPSQLVGDGEDHGAVAVTNVPLGALQVIGAWRLPQLVARVDDAVLRFAAFRAPTAATLQ